MKLIDLSTLSRLPYLKNGIAKTPFCPFLDRCNSRLRETTIFAAISWHNEISIVNYETPSSLR